MIIHIFPKEKFTIPYINFINERFDFNNHKFILYGKSDAFDETLIKIKDNVKELNSLNNINKELRESKMIIFHSLIMTNKFLMYLLLKFKLGYKLLKKCNWIIWGGDLYYFIDKKKSPSYLLRKIIIKKFGYITSLVNEDYRVAKEVFEVNGIHKKAIYINPLDKKALDKFKGANYNTNIINIQIGNSAFMSNNHKEVIDILEKYKDENIKIFVPLSYGDEKAALDIAEYGKQKFGEKFVPLLDFMSPDEYSQYLSRIDIAIFNNDRQQALGNIFALSYLQCKIYMRNDTTMWKDLTIEEGYRFNTIEDLKNSDFKNFIKKDIKNIDNNKKIAKNRFDEKYIAEVWRKLFEC